MTLFTVGCGGDSPAATMQGTPATFTAIYAEIFPATTNARCNFCHSMPARDTSNGKLGVGSDRDSAFAALVGTTSSSSHCNGMSLVVPHHPEQSLFYLKLSSDPPPCGSRMPIGGKHLSDNQLAMIRSWIEGGAADD
ncbi:MAG: hypothetical protein QM778_30195 [Myxococcales bacterium]